MKSNIQKRQSNPILNRKLFKNSYTAPDIRSSINSNDRRKLIEAYLSNETVINRILALIFPQGYNVDELDDKSVDDLMK